MKERRANETQERTRPRQVNVATTCHQWSPGSFSMKVASIKNWRQPAWGGEPDDEGGKKKNTTEEWRDRG